MRLIVNGEAREIAAARVTELLQELEFAGTHVAVAVNHRVVPRSRWAETMLSGGDHIEIVTPRQGG
jgi:sulfur carrier protein